MTQERQSARKKESKLAKIKKGDKIKMGLSGAGVVSYGYWPIIKLTKDHIFLMGGRSEEEEPFKFDRKTGRCLNDDTTFGFYRFIVFRNPRNKTI